MTEREPPHRAAWSGNWRDEDNRPGPAAGQPTLAERVAALCDSWEKPGSWPEPVRITFNVCADELRALLEAFEGGGDIG